MYIAELGRLGRYLGPLRHLIGVVVGYPADSQDGAHVSGPVSFNFSGHIRIKDTQLFSAPGPGK